MAWQSRAGQGRAGQGRAGQGSIARQGSAPISRMATKAICPRRPQVGLHECWRSVEYGAYEKERHADDTRERKKRERQSYSHIDIVGRLTQTGGEGDLVDVLFHLL